MLASTWHTDADLGRPVEVIADMGKSRKLGFLSLFDELCKERVIPARA